MSSTQGSLPFDAEFDTGATAALAAAALLRGALPATPGEHDELRSDDGALRPPWQRFAGLMPAPAAGRALGAELDHRRDQVAQQIRRDGVTHNVFGSEGVASRPWSL
ncbi:MAG: hypothetical protein Q8L92_14605, partial [Rubrivivax sp.]|nr:hypothetical protein [Rubrivivax sp.]